MANVTSMKVNEAKKYYMWIRYIFEKKIEKPVQTPEQWQS